MEIKTFGSVCSGIEAASFVLMPLGVRALWLSEIDGFRAGSWRLAILTFPMSEI